MIESAHGNAPRNTERANAKPLQGTVEGERRRSILGNDRECNVYGITTSKSSTDAIHRLLERSFTAYRIMNFLGTVKRHLEGINTRVEEICKLGDAVRQKDAVCQHANGKTMLLCLCKDIEKTRVNKRFPSGEDDPKGVGSGGTDELNPFIRF